MKKREREREREASMQKQSVSLGSTKKKVPKWGKWRQPWPEPDAQQRLAHLHRETTPYKSSVTRTGCRRAIRGFRIFGAEHGVASGTTESRNALEMSRGTRKKRVSAIALRSAPTPRGNGCERADARATSASFFERRRPRVTEPQSGCSSTKAGDKSRKR